MKNLKNLIINKKDKNATLSINPKIFPLEVIYSAAYVLMDKAYIILDGDPEKKIEIFIKIKGPKGNVEKIVMEFNNELINYSVYVIQAARTSEIRRAIVERALMTNTFDEDDKYDEDVEVKDDEEIEFIDDPLGIAKPWTPDKSVGIKKLDLKED